MTPAGSALSGGARNLIGFLDAFKAADRSILTFAGRHGAFDLRSQIAAPRPAIVKFASPGSDKPPIDAPRVFCLTTSRSARAGKRRHSPCRSQLMKKVYPDAKSALDGLLRDGMMIMSGGFGLCGIPETLSEAIRDSGVKDLTFVSNNAGVDGIGLSRLLETRQIRKMISSYVGENKLFAQQYLAGDLELEFNPQGTLAERIRAGGAGIPAFYTKTGVGTLIAEGKEVKEFDGQKYLMERGLFADLAIVHAWKGDTAGNLVYRKTARNFNPMMATAAKVTVAEVEHLVPAGEIDPDHVHTPGIFVKRIVEVGGARKHIEFRNTRPRPAAA
ncbi:coenzyme A transferase [Nitrobacter winogradskyi Nb-255]|uniref:Coenzyme A transferase n=2 Tax=Nitrobacter winogradskyi TaxID=913 RepID=Q3STW9_NITWN|nr:coenzyme A transferase [Nitrobacter winogradskyi Nb-255]